MRGIETFAWAVCKSLGSSHLGKGDACTHLRIGKGGWRGVEDMLIFHIPGHNPLLNEFS